MPRHLILLVAILAARIVAASTPALILSGPHELKWTGWGVKINHLEFTDTVTRYGVEKHPDADSTFVYMDLTVTNLGHKGSTFIPQNTLKIIIGDNEFDAEDLDGEGGGSISNIEPTLARQRECYFELPLMVLKDFIIRFGESPTEAKDISITISSPAPTPDPVVEAPTPPLTNVVSAVTGNRWTPDALIVSGTLTNTSRGAVLITGINAKGFNQDQKMVSEGSDFTIARNNLAPGEVVNFKVALKDGTKQVKFVTVLPSWSP